MGVSIQKKRQSSIKKKLEDKTTTKQLYRKIIVPTQKKVSITLPETLVGKTVEVFAFEVLNADKSEITTHQQFSIKDFWDTFGSGKRSLISANSIRENAWRKYKW